MTHLREPCAHSVAVLMPDPRSRSEEKEEPASRLCPQRITNLGDDRMPLALVKKTSRRLRNMGPSIRVAVLEPGMAGQCQASSQAIAYSTVDSGPSMVWANIWWSRVRQRLTLNPFLRRHCEPQCWQGLHWERVAKVPRARTCRRYQASNRVPVTHDEGEATSSTGAPCPCRAQQGEMALLGLDPSVEAMQIWSWVPPKSREGHRNDH